MFFLNAFTNGFQHTQWTTVSVVHLPNDINCKTKYLCRLIAANRLPNDPIVFVLADTMVQKLLQIQEKQIDYWPCFFKVIYI